MQTAQGRGPPVSLAFLRLVPTLPGRPLGQGRGMLGGGRHGAPERPSVPERHDVSGSACAERLTSVPRTRTAAPAGCSCPSPRCPQRPAWPVTCRGPRASGGRRGRDRALGVHGSGTDALSRPLCPPGPVAVPTTRTGPTAGAARAGSGSRVQASPAAPARPLGPILPGPRGEISIPQSAPAPARCSVSQPRFFMTYEGPFPHFGGKEGRE